MTRESVNLGGPSGIADVRLRRRGFGFTQSNAIQSAIGFTRIGAHFLLSGMLDNFSACGLLQARAGDACQLRKAKSSSDASRLVKQWPDDTLLNGDPEPVTLLIYENRQTKKEVQENSLRVLNHEDPDSLVRMEDPRIPNQFHASIQPCGLDLWGLLCFDADWRTPGDGRPKGPLGRGL